MEKKNIIQIKKEKKKRNPEFKRHASWRKRRISKAWRRPRGSDSKARVEKKGNVAVVKSGYRTPAKIRGREKEGLELVKVSNLKELRSIDASKQIALISAVGLKRREILLRFAKEKGINIYNFKIDNELEKIGKIIEKKKSRKMNIKKKRKTLEEKIKNEEKKKEIKEKPAEKLNEEEKKKQKEEEKRKVLIKKEN